jgi:hypothetical protein
MFLFFVVVIDNAKLVCSRTVKNGETTQWDGQFFTQLADIFQNQYPDYRHEDQPHK